MRQFTPKISGSLWSKGFVGILAGAIIVVGLLIWVLAIRWFFAIAVVIGLLMAAVIHWWNEHHEVKLEDEGEIRLGLLDEDEKKK
jgi:Na+-translocating ferredoxin:NAD+ oxidoreductase RnfD subunit